MHKIKKMLSLTLVFATIKSPIKEAEGEKKNFCRLVDWSKQNAICFISADGNDQFIKPLSANDNIIAIHRAFLTMITLLTAQS